MDALAFASLFGRREIATIIAEKLANGDPDKVAALLDEAYRIAVDNTVPVKPGDPPGSLY